MRILFEKLYRWHYLNMFHTLFRIRSTYFCVQKYYYDLSSFGMEDREEVCVLNHLPYEITTLTSMLHFKKEKNYFDHFILVL